MDKIIIKLNDKNVELSNTKITGNELKKNDTELDSCWLYVDIPNQPEQRIIDDEATLNVKNGAGFITIPSSALQEGIIDIAECAKYNRRPPKGQKKYRIKIDGEEYTIDKPHLLGKEILALAGKPWQEFRLQQKFKEGKRESIKPEQDVDFSNKGIERFEAVPEQAQQG